MTTTSTMPTKAAYCPPVAVRVTKSLLGYGLIAGPFYVVVSLIEALTRPGFDLSRHSWSLLENGAFGWVHTVVFLLTGAMVIAAAVGVGRQLHAEKIKATAAWFLGLYGAGLLGAGCFRADPAGGFPIGTPAGPTVDPTWHGTGHLMLGGIGFLGLIVACLVWARRFQMQGFAAWAWFSLITGVVFLVAFVGIASGGAPGRPIVLTFTFAVVLAWTWLLLLSRHLYRRAGQSQLAD